MDQNSIYDIQTTQVMQRVLTPDSNCIDIGCHKGVFLDEILKLSPTGAHFGFEPIPELYEALVIKYEKYSNVRIRYTALSDVSGKLPFKHVVSNPGFSGLKERQYSRIENIKEISVQAALLDESIPDNLKISFIKIDVEGAELQVMRGAIKTLIRCQPVVVFEHGIGAADYYKTEPEMVFDLLQNCDLHCFTMEQWLTSSGERNLSRIEFADQFRSGRNFYFMAAPKRLHN